MAITLGPMSPAKRPTYLNTSKNMGGVGILGNNTNNFYNALGAKYTPIGVAAAKATVPKATSSNNSVGLANVLSNYDNFNTVTRTGGSYSASGTRPYEVAKADISGLLSAYEKSAETSRKNAETKYKNTKEDLLTSLKRFQEQNARDVQNQKQNYLAQQANLESARESANRQNRISVSARGLGGSGLQQLAQLQNLLGQGEEISKAAGENQTAMDKLATLLREYQEDNDKKMKLNEEERTSALDTIASTLANQKATAIAQNEEAYTNALNAMRQATSQYSYSSSPGTVTTSNTGALVRSVLDGLNRDLKSTANSKADRHTQWEKSKSLAKDAHNTIQEIIEAYGDSGYYNAYKNDVNNLMKAYNFGKYYS